MVESNFYSPASPSAKLLPIFCLLLQPPPAVGQLKYRMQKNIVPKNGRAFS
jgi:hypothetical protein